MSFTNEQTLTLIDMYRVRPILWDPTQMEYRNKNKTHDMMMEIAVASAIDKGDVEKKIANYICSRKKEDEGFTENGEWMRRNVCKQMVCLPGYDVSS
ncbi:hypothetical protein JTB14_017424 [Gonioctena quinquepunctata]|nr:hypothetical protein JTB14_017424 [Gonioctena quinquepunctata]